MDREDLVGVMVRLFSLAIVVYVVSRAPTLAILFSQVADVRGLLFSGGIFLILLLLGGLFWFFPRSIARWLLPRRSDSAVITRWTAEEALSVGLVLVGIYLAYHVLSDAVTWSMLALFNSHSQSWELRPDERAAIVATLFEAVLAFWLVFGARGIGSLVWKLRTADTKNTQRSTPET